MKIFLRYLMLPLITACIVTISIVIFYHLDASKDKNNVILSEAKNPATSPRGLDTPKKSATASEVHTSEEATHNSQTAVSHKDFVYPIDDTRDPFQQVSTPIATQQPPSSDQPSIILTGIIWDEEDPVAIITDSQNNSYLVRTGEEISRTKVLAIRPRSITIERDGKTQELVLWPAKL
jgi:hypothetical protein